MEGDLNGDLDRLIGDELDRLIDKDLGDLIGDELDDRDVMDIRKIVFIVVIYTHLLQKYE